MGLFAKLRRHGLLTVCAALALWVAQPALAALCPCAPAETAGSAPVDADGDAGCCRGCCSPAAMARQVKPAASSTTAVCPLRGADFSPCAVVPGVADVATKVPHAVPGSGFVEPLDFLFGLPNPRAGEPVTGPPGPTLPCPLARLLATRCHPVHAPPVS